MMHRTHPRAGVHRLLWLSLLAAWLGLGMSAALANSTTDPPPAPTPIPLETPVLPTTGAAAQGAGFAPFLNVVPSQDGTGLLVSAGGVGQLPGEVFANVGIGPTGRKGGWTMTYSDTVEAYVANVVGFSPTLSEEGSINITTTTGLQTGDVSFLRAYVQAGLERPLDIDSADGNLRLTIANTDTFATEVYVAVAPSYGPPGPLPAGYRTVTSFYSVRASGAIAQVERPMLLRLFYNQTTLAGADQRTLRILAWDAFTGQWEEMGGRLLAEQQVKVAAIHRFTTYVLAATTTWHDTFDDFDGIDFTRSSNVTNSGAPQNRTMVLRNTPGEGVLVSQPITPPAGFTEWGIIAYAKSDDPPATSLTMDVLDADGELLLADVASGADLAGLLGPERHPTIRLRANLTATESGLSPVLEDWQISWSVTAHRLHLPLVVR